MVKVKNWNWRKFYIVMLFIMAVLVAGSFFLVKTHVYNPAQENGMKQVAPVSHEETTDGTDIYTFEFARLTPSTRNLLFNTNHQEVRVYMNKKMVYSTTKADSPFGHTTGAVWNQVDLPERGPSTGYDQAGVCVEAAVELHILSGKWCGDGE